MLVYCGFCQLGESCATVWLAGDPPVITHLPGKWAVQQTSPLLQTFTLSCRSCQVRYQNYYRFTIPFCMVACDCVLVCPLLTCPRSSCSDNVVSLLPDVCTRKQVRWPESLKSSIWAKMLVRKRNFKCIIWGSEAMKNFIVKESLIVYIENRYKK